MGYCTYFDGEFTISPALSLQDKNDFDQLDTAGYRGHDYPEWWTMMSDWPMQNPDKHRCDWRVSDDGEALGNEGEKTYYYVEQLEYLIKDFFAPRGYVLNGRVDWNGEETGDIGAIFIKDNVVKAVEAEIKIEDPFAE